MKSAPTLGLLAGLLLALPLTAFAGIDQVAACLGIVGQLRQTCRRFAQCADQPQAVALARAGPRRGVFARLADGGEAEDLGGSRRQGNGVAPDQREAISLTGARDARQERVIPRRIAGQ